MTETTHSPEVFSWFEDHKRGFAKPACSCGWEGPVRRISGSSKHEARMRMLREWRVHLPADRQPKFGVQSQADGSVDTGQAHVTVEGSDTLIMALSTRLTAAALQVHGFTYEIGNYDDATAIVIPAARVRSIEVYPWWDMHDLWERDMDKPQEALDEEASYT